LQQVRERNWAKQESRRYYMMRRDLGLKDLACSVISQDRDAIADALKALRIFNHQAPRQVLVSLPRT